MTRLLTICLVSACGKHHVLNQEMPNFMFLVDHIVSTSEMYVGFFSVVNYS